MLGFLRELSPINFVVSPVFSAIVVLLGITLGSVAFLKRAEIGVFTHSPATSMLVAAIAFFVVGILLISLKKIPFLGRVANVFIVAAVLDFAIALLAFNNILVI